MDPIHAFVKDNLEELPDIYKGKLPRNEAKRLYIFTDAMENIKYNRIIQDPLVFFTTRHGIVCFDDNENTYLGFSWEFYEEFRSNIVAVAPEVRERLISLTEEDKISFARYVDNGYRKFEVNGKDYAVAAIIFPDESSIVEVIHEVVSPEDITFIAAKTFPGIYLDLTEQLYAMKTLALPEAAATSEEITSEENGK